MNENCYKEGRKNDWKEEGNNVKKERKKERKLLQGRKKEW